MRPAVLGLSAGVIGFRANLYLKRVLKIDDSLDVFPVHGVGGMLSMMMAGILSAPSLGVFSGCGCADGITSMGEQLTVQATGIEATVVFTAVVTYVILKILDAVIGLCVNEEQKLQGLDIVICEERGYDLG
jgi:Amt family ammonium transporter